jgi:hypothetical protein
MIGLEEIEFLRVFFCELPVLNEGCEGRVLCPYVYGCYYYYGVMEE